MGLRTRSGSLEDIFLPLNRHDIATCLLLCAAMAGGACSEPGTTPGVAQQSTNLDGSAAAAKTLVTQNTPAAADPGAPDVSAPFDVGAVMRQVHFAFRAAKSGGFSGGHDTYGVSVSLAGEVTVTPAHFPGVKQAPDMDDHLRPWKRLTRPVPRTGTPATFSTVRIMRQHNLIRAAEVRASLAHDGSLELDRGAAVELLRNGEQGVEQSWRLARAPHGHGDLEIHVRVSGPKYMGHSEQGLHFVDPNSGVGLRYGHATWVDGDGIRTAVPTTFTDGEILLRVPGALLDRSSYPAVLDPVISPEFGMDSPAQGPAWGAQRVPRVASDGTDYLVVWDDYRHLKNDNYDIYGARVDAAGKVLDPGGILISGATGNQSVPTVAHDGNGYLVAWYDHRNNKTYPDIYGARLNATGTVQDPAGIAISTATSYQYYPKIAVGGGNFMVVWQDYRNGGVYANIYGARVSPAGKVLDPKGILISGASHHQVTPRLAFDGTNFMVVWMDYRNTYSIYTKTDVYGARVTTAGVLIDKSGFVICKQGSHQYYPTISYNPNGNAYLVVWQDYRNYPKTYWDIYGRMVATDGSLKGTVDIPISAAKGHQYGPMVANNGAEFFVVWQDGRNGVAYDVYGARISTAGVLVSNSEVIIASATGSQQSPELAWAKGGYLVAWEDHRNGTGIGSDIYAARVTGGGSTMDPSGIAVSTSAPNQVSPAVAYDGTNYLVVWQDRRDYASTSTDIYGVLVSPAGLPISSSGIAISKAAKEQRSPAVAYGGGNYLVVWQDYRAGWNIYGALVDTSGQVLHPTGVAINSASGNQLSPDVAHDGTNFFVVWEDYRSSATYPDIYGTRVNKYGGVMSASGLLISGAAYYQARPRVAYGVGNYLVVWEDYRAYTVSNWDIYGARVSTSGKLLDSTGIPISTEVNHQTAPALAHDSTNFLVVWQDYRNSSAGTSIDVYGARVSSAGNVLGSSQGGTAISVSGGDQLLPRVASANSSFLVAWEDYRNGKYNPDVMGTILSSGGVVQSTQGEALSATADHDFNPAVTSSGAGTYMVVYSRHSTTAGDGAARVKGRFVTELKKAGLACSAAKACSSGFCVDGVCCNSACGGGALSDCQACAVASGAKIDGTCGAIQVGTQCRAAAGPCDAVETCDGTSGTCPINQFKGSTVICRGSLGLCDQAETCSGTSATCPWDSYMSAGTTCRTAAGACDQAETCTGLGPSCPSDKYLGMSTTCRAAAGPCDLAETCSGSAGTCPTDKFKVSTVVCRAAAQECDIAENCSGASGLCPADLKKLDNTACSNGQCVSGMCLPPDMGPPDQGTPEAGPDSSQSADLTAPDQGHADVKVLPDTTSAVDSKSPGAEGTVTDPVNEEGCFCSAANTGGGGSAPGALLMLGLCLACVSRRRRR